MGTALNVLVHGPFEERSVVVETLIRVIGAVHWEDFTRHTYLHLYEHFLTAYDPELRKQSGAYYTPREIVVFMTGFVDEILRTRLERPLGLAADDVIVVDPGMGTGSFLTEVIHNVAATVEREEGPGQVPPRLRALADRLIGFENQAAAYAVAELRVHEAFKHTYGTEVPTREVRFLTDALDDPDIQELNFGQMYDALRASRQGANQVKRQIPVMVVIGNPPYRDIAKDEHRPWIEARGIGRKSRPTLDAFRAPGNGRFEHKLANMYLYFWRWGTWKVFDAHPENPGGIVAFISPSSYTTGQTFAGMREYLRRTADEGWVIDLSPEGHRPSIDTRVFPGNQRPLCIGVFIRRGRPDETRPATIHHVSVSGTQNQKFNKLLGLYPDGPGWTECSVGWQSPLRPPQNLAWMSMPSLSELITWSVPGISPNRTWVYAPEPETLHRRWQELVSAIGEEKRILMKETNSSNVTTTPEALPGQSMNSGPLVNEQGAPTTPTQIAYRAFDIQWTIPDSRLHHRPRPDLWRTLGPRQIFTIEQNAEPISGGPALTFTSLIPDMHFFNGRGGRILPLYRDAAGKVPNIAPRLLDQLSALLGVNLTADDLLAYMAGIAAHPAFTKRYQEELKSPGVRLPITTESSIFATAVEIGREIIWLHTYGERCVDFSANRPCERPRLPLELRPRVLAAISDIPDRMPEGIGYEQETQTLFVGDGVISPVSPLVWEYHVGGMRIIRKWFGYRKKNPAVKRSSALNDIRAERWTADMTGQLLDLLNVLGRCVALEPLQAQILNATISGPLVTVAELMEARVLPAPLAMTKYPPRDTAATLWSDAK